MSVTAIRQIRTVLGGDRFPRLESPSLRLEKFLQLEHAGNRAEVDAVVACHRRARIKAPTPRSPDTPDNCVTAKLGGRLIVNQAGGVLENAGLCLHRHFGWPMIPGSAVKGVARHAAWQQWYDTVHGGADGDDTAEGRGLALRIAAVFGFPTMDKREAGLDEFLGVEFPDLFHHGSGTLCALSGSVSFLAAVPVDPVSVELVCDIVNCHHPQYYNGERSQATDDEQKLILVFFPTVEQGAEFRFTVLPGRRPPPPALAALLPAEFHAAEAARAWLVEGLTLWGAGAKTAAGYGWFEYDENADRQRRAEAAEAARVAEEERQRQAEKAARLAAMSPAERAAAEYWDALPAANRVGEFKGRLSRIASLPEDEQRSLLILCSTRGRTAWDADRADHDKVADNPKKRAKSKSYSRVVAAREAAEKLGIELP